MLEMDFTELGIRVRSVTNGEYDVIAGLPTSGNSPYEHAYYVSPIPAIVPHRREGLPLLAGLTPLETWNLFVKALQENPDKYNEYLENISRL